MKSHATVREALEGGSSGDPVGTDEIPCWITERGAECATHPSCERWQVGAGVHGYRRDRSCLKEVVAPPGYEVGRDSVAIDDAHSFRNGIFQHWHSSVFHLLLQRLCMLERQVKVVLSLVGKEKTISKGKVDRTTN